MSDWLALSLSPSVHDQHRWKTFVFDESFCPPEAKTCVGGESGSEERCVSPSLTFTSIGVHLCQRPRDRETLNNPADCVWGWLRQPLLTWAVHRHHLVADPVHSAVLRIPAKNKLASRCRCLQTCIVYTVNTKSVHSNQACQVFFCLLFSSIVTNFCPTLDWTHFYTHTCTRNSQEKPSGGFFGCGMFVGSTGRNPLCGGIINVSSCCSLTPWLRDW